MLEFIISIISINLVVLIHELGHYSIAKIFAMEIDEFAIGFGKTIFYKKDKNNTMWKLNILPLGGFVKIKDFYSNKKSNCSNKYLCKQLLTILAGPLSNYLLSIIIFSIVYSYYGIKTFEPIIGQVIKKSIAEEIGLLKNDKIITINNEIIKSFFDIKKIINSNKKSKISIVLIRNNLHIKKSFYIEKDQKALIGIKSNKKHIYQKLNFFESLSQATKQINYIIILIVKKIGQMLTGRGPMHELAGPIKITTESTKLLKLGGDDFMIFIGLISINLAVMNCIPIPILDGGQIVILLYEKFIKKINTNSKEFLFKISAFLIILIIAISISNDIKNLSF